MRERFCRGREWGGGLRPGSGTRGTPSPVELGMAELPPRFVVLTAALAISVAAGCSSTQAQRTADCYLVTRILAEYPSDAQVVRLQHIESGEVFRLRRTGKPILVHLPSGSYELRSAIPPRRGSLEPPISYDSSRGPLELMPGHTNYIGDLRFVRQNPHMVLPDLVLEHEVSDDVPRWFLANHAAVASTHPLILVRPGVAPTLLGD